MAYNKYRAVRTEVDGIKFHSKKEAKRYLQLKAMLQNGEISDLELQPKYDLMVNGTKIGYYLGDFRYVLDGETILEDVKSKATITPTYRLKKKILATYDPPVIITEFI